MVIEATVIASVTMQGRVDCVLVFYLLTLRVLPVKLSRLCFKLPVLLMALGSFAGCSDGRPSLVPVSGKVTLNGAPLAGALIGFEPDGIDGYNRPSISTTDSSGNFVVGTYDKADGMPAGKYKVTVLKKEVVGKVPENFNTEDTAANVQPVRYQWTVPRKYSTSADSGLTVEVTSSGMTPSEIALSGEAETESASSVPAP